MPNEVTGVQGPHYITRPISVQPNQSVLPTGDLTKNVQPRGFCYDSAYKDRRMVGHFVEKLDI